MYFISIFASEVENIETVTDSFDDDDEDVPITTSGCLTKMISLKVRISTIESVHPHNDPESPQFANFS